MKKNLLKLLAPFFILLLSATCSKKFTNDAIKNALANEENCLKACDVKADKALTEYENCKNSAGEEYGRDAARCEHLIPANQAACEKSAMKKYETALNKCWDEYKTKLDDVKKCRKECRDKFPHDMGIE